MLTLVIIKTAFAVGGMLVGWFAKRWHLQPYIDYLESVASSVPASEAKTPVDRPPTK